MKTLFVLRHGNAETASPGGDIRRELSERGRKNAAEAGKKIADASEPIDLIVSSGAQRAIETARIVADRVHIATAIAENEDIYDAEVDELLGVVRCLPDTAAHVIFVGHNPGFQGLVQRLLPQSTACPPLTPASFASLELAIERWVDVDAGVAQMRGFFSPRD